MCRNTPASVTTETASTPSAVASSDVKQSISKGIQDLNRLWRIRGKAYNFPDDWLERHPGGSYMLEITRGTDCTEVFEMYHAASFKEDYIRRTLAKYEVAGIKVPPSDDQWEKTPVYDELKTAVREYRREHGIKGTDSIPYMLWLAAWAVVHYYTCVWWMVDNGWTSGILLGVSTWFWAASITHDGMHYALSYNATAGEAVGWLGGMVFMNPAMWVRQHVTGHHAHCNVAGRDPDLGHLGVAPDALYRIDPRIEPHKLQAQLVLMPWVSQIIPVLVSPVEVFVDNHWKGVTDEFVWAKGERAQMMFKWFLVSSAIIYRVYTFGFFATTLPIAIIGVTFYAFSQVSHINPKSFEPCDSDEWAVQQIHTCQGDYGYDSTFWNVFSIGLNNQALHHIFPSVHHCHYPALGQLVKPIFEKHGLPTAGWDHSYLHSISTHLAHVWGLNDFREANKVTKEASDETLFVTKLMQVTLKVSILGFIVKNIFL